MKRKRDVGKKAVGDTDLINESLLQANLPIEQTQFDRFSALQLYLLKWSLERNVGVRIPDSLCLVLHPSPGELCFSPNNISSLCDSWHPSVSQIKKVFPLGNGPISSPFLPPEWQEGSKI